MSNTIAYKKKKKLDDNNISNNPEVQPLVCMDSQHK